MQLRVLGSVDVLTDEGQTLAPRRRQERLLLGVLLLESGRPVPVSRLCGLLWDGEPPDGANAAIRTYASRIRTLLAKGGAQRCGVTLSAQRGGYQLSSPASLVDVHRFRLLVEQALDCADLTERDRVLCEALALWRGPVLYDAADDERRRRLSADLDELRLHAVEESLATRLDLGRGREVLPELARLGRERPIRERLVELHMLALYQARRTTEALQVYTNARVRLADECGLDPGPALNRLHRMILDGRPVDARSSRPVPARPAVAPRAARTRMTTEEISSMVAALGSILDALRDADPADKAQIYSGVGLRLT